MTSSPSNKRPSLRLLAWLFFINVWISSFTFGGGYVVIPMIRKYFVQKKKLLTEEKVMDLAAIAQSSPGAIAVNLASLAGYQAAGLAGALVSCAASILPALVILSLVSLWYAALSQSAAVAAVLKGMEAGVAALIVDLCIDMFQVILKERIRLLPFVVAATFIGSYCFRINVAILLAGSCLLCAAVFLLAERRKAQPVKSWPGEAQPDEAWPGEAWPDEAWPGEAQSDEAWPGEAWPGEVRPGEAWPGEIWPNEAWSGEARLSEPSPDTPQPGKTPGDVCRNGSAAQSGKEGIL